jgi:dCMP deaminase
MRKDWDTYWMEMAFQVSTRATCLRRAVGAVIVLNNEVVAMGYNGAPRKTDQCDEVGCYMEDGVCIRTVHAEANALLRAPRDIIGAHIYSTDYPCVNCARLIANTGITRLYFARPYPPHPYATELMGRLEVVELPLQA